jgi:hypothetical protein
MEIEDCREALNQLNDASTIELGFPHDFISANTAWVLGAADVTTR